jgi:hypothetical protein
MKPMVIGSSPATAAILSTTGPSTATAAPAVMVLETPTVSAEIATSRPSPCAAPKGRSAFTTECASHSAAPVACISTPSETAAA